MAKKEYWHYIALRLRKMTQLEGENQKTDMRIALSISTNQDIEKVKYALSESIFGVTNGISIDFLRNCWNKFLQERPVNKNELFLFQPLMILLQVCHQKCWSLKEVIDINSDKGKSLKRFKKAAFQIIPQLKP